MKENQFPKVIPIKGRVRICVELIKKQDIKNKIVVDIGSSFGWLEKEMVDMGAKKIIGVEQDKDAVEFAQKNVAGAKFLVGNVLNIPLSENIADVIIFYDVLEHVPKGTEEQALSEINRILKKGGTLLFSTPNSHILSNLLDIAWYFGHRHYTKNQITNFLENNGFKILQISSKGSIFSSIYLIWFYMAKRIFNIPMPRNKFLEKHDDEGYKKGDLTDVFLVAQKF